MTHRLSKILAGSCSSQVASSMLRSGNRRFNDADARRTDLSKFFSIPLGSSLIYSTYLGGSDMDWGYGIAADSEGNAYVAGLTYSYNFPTANAYQDHATGYGAAFVTKLNPSGSAFVYSTYLGGGGDWAWDIAVDAAGNAYIAGAAASIYFPVKHALQPAKSPPNDIYHYQTDAFVTKLNSSGSDLLYSTYLGGSSDDSAWGIAVDPAGNAYIVGFSQSVDFPMQPASPPFSSLLQSVLLGTPSYI